MLTIRLKGEKEFYRAAIRVENTVAETSGDFTFAVAEAVKEYMRGHWSATQQAIGAGNPPAIKTGNLDSSITVDKQARTLQGFFAKLKDSKLTFIRVETSKGNDPQGRGNYAQALEDEDYYNLPFMQPALDAIEPTLGDLAKRYIKT